MLHGIPAYAALAYLATNMRSQASLQRTLLSNSAQRKLLTIPRTLCDSDKQR